MNTTEAQVNGTAACPPNVGVTVLTLSTLLGLLLMVVFILVVYILKVRVATPKHGRLNLSMVNAQPPTEIKDMGQTVGTQVNLGDFLGHNIAAIPEAEDITMRDKPNMASDQAIYHSLLEGYETDRVSHPYEDVECTKTTLRPFTPATLNTCFENSTGLNAHRKQVPWTMRGEGSEMHDTEQGADSIPISAVDPILSPEAPVKLGNIPEQNPECYYSLITHL
ncbi:uncharacterized protein [Haliotis cracherodii]|uniref:uncharacterized protein n=1 Tax=Haliotis cracherodii TaxID=6455 RepID=UPI0039EBBE92